MKKVINCFLFQQDITRSKKLFEADSLPEDFDYPLTNEEEIDMGEVDEIIDIEDEE